ncbi:MAG: RidA family protein [Myxococcales bacterium]|nr:RidA family protein [Myxococcales bacterium]
MEDKIVIFTENAPAAIGPYSQAVVAPAGRLVFTSGQIALDPASGQIIDGDIEAQTRRVMQNLQAVLQAAGADFSNVVKTTIFLSDLQDFGTVNAVYGSYFADMAKPARSTVEVRRLPRDVGVEIDMIAVIS